MQKRNPFEQQALAVREDFSIEVSQQITQSETELTLISEKGISSQAQVETANVSLKKSKTLIKSVESERKQMTSILDDAKKKIMNKEKELVQRLSDLTGQVNNLCIAFQIEKDKKDKEEADKIKKEKEEKLKKENAEIERKAQIKKDILGLRLSIYEANESATSENIEHLIRQLVDFVPGFEDYEEFLKEAIEAKNEGLDLLVAKQQELKNRPKGMPIGKSSLPEYSIRDLTASLDLEVLELKQNAAANIQMEAELKESMIEKSKGISKTWVFDEENIDIDILPREFCTFDKAKIKKYIAEGGRSIQGVNIFQKINNVSR